MMRRSSRRWWGDSGRRRRGRYTVCGRCDLVAICCRWISGRLGIYRWLMDCGWAAVRGRSTITCRSISCSRRSRSRCAIRCRSISCSRRRRGSRRVSCGWWQSDCRGRRRRRRHLRMRRMVIRCRSVHAIRPGRLGDNLRLRDWGRCHGGRR